MPDILIDYKPRKQFEAFHDRTQRFACIVAHRRAGKTVACVQDLQRGALLCKLIRPRFAYIAPFLSQAKQAAWDYLQAASLPFLDHGATINQSELRVDYPNGGRVRLHGADNADALRGGYFDGVVLDEVGDIDPELWSRVIRPALSDRMGWAVFIGTPKGRNGFWDIVYGDKAGKWPGASRDPDWFYLQLKASETGLISAPELADNRKTMDEDEYAQEYECSFDAALKGAFYADALRQMDEGGRLRAIPIERALVVDTAWDLGRTDSTAIWFIQNVGRERRLIDYYESSGVGLHHYAQVLRERGYLYGTHYLPHDVKVHELTSDKSRLATLEGLGVKPVSPGTQVNVLDGINAVRRMLDRTFIDPVRCERGLEALKQYRREWDDKLKDWKQNPRHDWTSHGADALREYAVQYDDPIGVAEDKVDRHRRRPEREQRVGYL